MMFERFICNHELSLSISKAAIAEQNRNESIEIENPY